MYKWESCNYNTTLFDYSFEGNGVNCGGGQIFTGQSSDGVRGCLLYTSDAADE